MKQEQLYQQILERKIELQHLIGEYWHQYSDAGTWYFWFNLLTFIIPLLILYFAIDKKRLFEISFYGYTVHVIWANFNGTLAESGYFIHPHNFFSFLTDGMNMSSVVLPIAFMLLYQYSTNHGKNVYLWTIFGSIFFAFIYAPIEMKFGMLRLENGMNLFYVFLIDLIAAFIAYWLTLLFQRVKSKYTGKRKKE